VNLKDSIARGKFREDLYYRLNTVPIKVPPLRERKDDILILFRKFSVDFAERYRRQPIQLDETAKQVLLNYTFPGNIRELKNIAEQASVLSVDKEISAKELLPFMPDGRLDSFPVPLFANTGNNGGSFATERDMMYQVLFDMKKDVNDLKQTMSNLLQGNAVNSDFLQSNHFEMPQSLSISPTQHENNVSNSNQPIIIQHAPVIEETLNIAEKEKELIAKALKKYKGRRRDAALELGISERTLYRKLKEYGLEDF
jgi:DNA-binding NtrC family response regulator